MAKVTGKAGLRVDIDTSERAFTIKVMDDGKLARVETFNLDELPSEIALEAQLRGTATVLQQRVSDVDGGAFERLSGIVNVWQMWCNGDYRAERTSGTRQVAPIIEVLVAMKSKQLGKQVSIASVQDAWAKLDADARKLYEIKYADEIFEVKRVRLAHADDEITL